MPGGLEEIGQRLRAARDSRGLSLLTAEEETKIRRKYLEALEAGRRDELPDEVYVKGYIRTYGNYLGLDGAALVGEYKRAQRGEAGERAQEGRPGGRPRPAASVAVTRDPVKPAPRERPRRPARERSRPGRGRAVSWGMGAAVALVGLVLMWLLWAPSGSRDAGAPGAAPVAPPPEAPPPAAPDPPRAEPAPVTPPPETAVRVELGAPLPKDPAGPTVPIAVSPGPVNVALTFRDRAWVSVEADGKQVVQGIFNKGSVERYSATEQMVITVGWVNVVEFTVNGKDLGAVLQEPYHRVVITAKQP